MKIVNVIKDSFQECAPFKWGLTLFSHGCNLCCDICKGYNYEMVMNKENIIGDAIEIITKNITSMHDSVIFIGGEPTIYGEKLIQSLKFCKDRGLKTKIFTNGMLPSVVQSICDKKLCDAWSVDYKGISDSIAPFIGIEAESYLTNIRKTIKYIIENKLPLEIRTTFFDGNIKDKEIIKGRMVLLKEGIYKKYNKYPYFKYIEQYDIREHINQ